MLVDRNALKMLKRMGVKAEEKEGERAILELKDERIIIENPKIIITEFSGQKVYQIMGKEVVEEKISEEDIKIVMEKTGKSREEVEKALKECKGDIAEAIIMLSQQPQS